MQTVSAAWTAEEKDSVRQIVQSTLFSWHKQNTIGNRTFTIGVSIIGGNDIIGSNPGNVGSPANYKYFDETPYVMSLSWERGLNMPLGGLAKTLAEAYLDNTSGRFTPRYMGGNSELATAQPLRVPMIINAGFKLGGISQTIPQFAGIITEQPEYNVRTKQMHIRAADYLDFFQNRYLDQQIMFTGQRTDQVMTTLASALGMNTAQYDFDTGINVIPFGFFESGTRFADLFNLLAQSEYGHFYQDEQGIFKFENRQHWNNAPYTSVQKLITTAMVIDAESPNMDHLINVVEIRSKVINKQPNQTIFKLSTPLSIPHATDTSLFVSFDDPILQMDDVTQYVANTASDNSGVDITSSVTIKSVSKFSQAAKITFTNSDPKDGFLTDLTVTGRPARASNDLYTRVQDDSSVTAFQERVLNIDNPYIQNQDWANSLAQMILNDFSSVENLQRIKIRAIPELQMGDLISWQGRYWRVFDLRTNLDPTLGFIQELLLLQRSTATYFRIGISTIGGSDKIAP